MGALVYSVIPPLVTGDGIGFLALIGVVAGGIGLVGSLAGVVAALLLPIGKIGRAVAGGLFAFVTTLAFDSLPGLIVDIGLAASVSLAVLFTLIVTEWLRKRALKPEQT
jgi:membrane protein implicated in regulation of membrane protease activity